MTKIIDSLLPLAMDIGLLKPDPRNARRHPERNIDTIKRSLEQYGQRKPIVVRAETMHIEAGNGMYEAAKALGWEQIAAVLVDDDHQTATGFGLMDNQSAVLAEWDTPTLNDLLADLQSAGFDTSLTGFTEDEIGRLCAQCQEFEDGLTDEDDIPEPPEEPITQRGDLWILGDHRLLCGDSTSIEDVRRVMNGERAILFATDPPYLVDYDGTNHPHKWNESDKNKDWSESYGTTWDEASGNEDLYDKFVEVAVAEAILPNAAWYCWHASRRQAMVEAVWEKHGAFVHQQIIWAKDRPILTRSWYMWQHEPCFFGWVRPNKPPRIAEDYPHSVWDLPTVKCGEGTDHPTSKPVEVFAIPIRQHTVPGDVCYEPFAGSGSQIIAAEELGRRCFALEISPMYCDVIIRRWEEYTGNKAKRA